MSRTSTISSWPSSNIVQSTSPGLSAALRTTPGTRGRPGPGCCAVPRDPGPPRSRAAAHGRRPRRGPVEGGDGGRLRRARHSGSLPRSSGHAGRHARRVLHANDAGPQRAQIDGAGRVDSCRFAVRRAWSAPARQWPATRWCRPCRWRAIRDWPDSWLWPRAAVSSAGVITGGRSEGRRRPVPPQEPRLARLRTGAKTASTSSLVSVS